MIHIKIDNIAQYFWRITENLDVWKMSDYAPIILCPFDNVVFFYKEDGEQYRLKVETTKIEKDEIGNIKNGFNKLDFKGGGSDKFNFQGMTHLMIIHISVNGFNVGNRTFYIRNNGQDYESWLKIFSDELDIKHMSNQDIIDLVDWNTAPILMAISFMHCKNVELIDEPLTRQRRRKLERKGGIRYKVLDIEPFKKQVRRETQPGESQLHRALHICRGHFATYTEDKPLFGKITGTFWKPMHVRGNKKQGQVVKDYNIVLDE